MPAPVRAATPGLISSRASLANESTTDLNGPQSRLQFGMKQVPDVHHLRPDLKIDVNVRGTRDLGKSQRVVEQRLGSADLDEQGREPGEVGIDGRCQRRTRIGAVQV